MKDLWLVSQVTAHTVKVFLKKTLGSPEENPISSALNPFKVWVEGLVIFPGYTNLLSVLVTARKMGQHWQARPNVDDYIQLTRFIDKDNMDRISCDWCSIINGYLELMFDAMEGETAENILKIRNLPYTLTKLSLFALVFVPYSAVDDDIDLSDERIENFLRTKGISYESEEKKTIFRFIRELLLLRHICGQLESRWCPFGYTEQLLYVREYWATDIAEVRATLQRIGKINCKDCVRDLNQLVPLSEQISSIFEGYLAQVQAYLSRPATA
jgi:hypothetical protein